MTKRTPRAVVGALLLLSLAAASATAQSEPTGEVHGIVRGTHDASGAPLPYAMVELVAGGGGRTVLADSTGRYVLRGVPAGMRRVRAQHIGHAPGEVEVLVPAGGAVGVDLALARQPVVLPAVAVMAAPIVLPAVERLGLRPVPPAWAASKIALRSLAEGTGMAEAGVTRAAGGGDEGGSDPADPKDVLLMRGSTTDLKLVLLDGAPVYTPFHLGGLLPSFDATTMGGAALHVGGAPARYDGGLSYILDLRTRSPRRDGLHDGAAALWGGTGSPYGYADGLLRFAAEPAAGHRLSLTFFANRESVFLYLESKLGLSGPDAARWGNDALSLGYHAVAGATQIDVVAAATRYRAELPIPPTAAARTAAEQAGGRAAPTLARGETDRLRLSADAARPLGQGTLRFGGAADRMEV